MPNAWRRSFHFPAQNRNVPLEIDIIDIYLRYFNCVGQVTVKLYYYLYDLVCVLNLSIYILYNMYTVCVYIYIHTLYTYTYTYVQVRTSKVFANAESFLPAADGWTWARCWPTAPWARWCGSQWASLAVGTRATRDLEVPKTGWKDQEHVDLSQG